MNRKELITEVTNRMREQSEGSLVSQTFCNQWLDTFASVVSDELKAGRDVTVSGFVKFSRKVVGAKKEHEGRNPRTGEVVEIPAKPSTFRIRISALKHFKETVVPPR